MNHYLKYPIIASILLITISLHSCNDHDLKPEFNPAKGINILIGDELLIPSEEIKYYDQSSHSFYLNSTTRYSLQAYGDSKYWILSDGEVIYDGTFVDFGISKQTPGLSTMQFNDYNSANFLLTLNQLFCGDTSDTSRADLRLNENFIKELKRQGIYHSGLDCYIDSLKLKNPKEVMLYYHIKNNDSFNFYLLDQQKLPSENHYNYDWMMTIYDSDFKKDYYTYQSLNYTYIKDRKWDINWLTLIKSSESKSFSKSFNLSEDIQVGTYWISVNIPSLGSEFNIFEEIQLDSGQIWLGEFELFRKVEIK